MSHPLTVSSLPCPHGTVFLFPYSFLPHFTSSSLTKYPIPVPPTFLPSLPPFPTSWYRSLPAFLFPPHSPLFFLRHSLPPPLPQPPLCSDDDISDGGDSVWDVADVIYCRCDQVSPRCTVVQNSYESRHKYWATRSSVRSWESEFLMSQNDLVLSHSGTFLASFAREFAFEWGAIGSKAC